MPIAHVVLAAFFMASSQPATLMNALEDRAETACALVRDGTASDGQLQKDVYEPAASAILSDTKKRFGKISGGMGTSAEKPTASPEVLASASSGVAGLIQERYRQQLRVTGEKAPLSGEPEGNPSQAASSENIRDYCRRLTEMKVQKLYPAPDFTPPGQRRPASRGK